MRRAVLAVAAACSSSPSKPVSIVAPKPVPAAAAPTVTTDPLDLEGKAGDPPPGWRVVVGSHHTAVLDGEAHHGATSLRLASTPTALDAEIGAAYVTIDATPYREARVRIHGWIKTADVDNYAGVWLRADDGLHGFDNRSARATWTTDWHEVIAETTVAPDATSLDVGVQLAGHGTAWFDALAIEVVRPEPPKSVVVTGHVIDPTGQPVAHADIVMSRSRDNATYTTTDESGRFELTTTAGKRSFSAHRAPNVGSLIENVDVTADTDVEIRLANRDGTTIHGTVKTTSAIPGGSFAIVGIDSDHRGDSWRVPITSDRRFTAIVPHGKRYRLHLVGPLIGEASFDGGKDTIAVSVDATVLTEPPPLAVVDYVRAHAAPLATTEPGHGFADLGPIGAIVGNAHVVGLGEATHGTHEFFQIKHRLFEYLVAEKGFTVFAIEASEPEARAVNAYVRDGKGDARSALAGLYFWTWDTEEVVALIEWMRAWNADASHVHKLSFAGFDMQFTRVAFRTVADFLAVVDATPPDALLDPIRLFANQDPDDDFKKGDTAAMVSALGALAKHFDDHKVDYVRRTSAESFAAARHDVTVMQQFATMNLAPNRAGAGVVRDRAMTDNIEWLRAQAGSDAKIVVWAHNGHVTKEPGEMGEHLAKRLGSDYVNLGLVFAEGSFQAWFRNDSIRENSVPPAPSGDVTAPFTAIGAPLLALDLRRLPAPVASWFKAGHPMYDVGSVFYDASGATSIVGLSKAFDAVIYVAHTTRARPAKTY